MSTLTPTADVVESPFDVAALARLANEVFGSLHTGSAPSLQPVQSAGGLNVPANPLPGGVPGGPLPQATTTQFAGFGAGAPGLNLVPNVLPLSAQTSTKMLEYLAVGLPVISSRSLWAEHIAAEHPGRVRWLIALTSPQAWRQAVGQLPAPEADRQHLRHLSWDARLQSLPLWQALGL